MKLFLLLLSFLFTVATTPRDDGGKASRITPQKATFRLNSPHVRLGRCSGDAYCRACSNCNYCGHCAGGGGTCGVCAPSAPRASRSPSRASSRGVRSYRVGGSSATAKPAREPIDISVTGDYYVAAATLNLRAAPSADSMVIRVLERNEVVTVQELTSTKWVKVTVTTPDGVIEGYLARLYLSETETY